MISKPPEKKTKDIRVIGLNFYFKRVPKERVFRAHVNSDFWKKDAQSRFLKKPGHEGALTMYSTKDSKEHFTFGKHMVAEQEVQEFEEGRGMVRKWKIKTRNNHYLDATAYAGAAGEYVIVARIAAKKRKRPWGEDRR